MSEADEFFRKVQEENLSELEAVERIIDNASITQILGFDPQKKAEAIEEIIMSQLGTALRRKQYKKMVEDNNAILLQSLEDIRFDDCLSTASQIYQHRNILRIILSIWFDTEKELMRAFSDVLSGQE